MRAFCVWGLLELRPARLEARRRLFAVLLLHRLEGGRCRARLLRDAPQLQLQLVRAVGAVERVLEVDEVRVEQHLERLVERLASEEAALLDGLVQLAGLARQQQLANR